MIESPGRFALGRGAPAKAVSTAEAEDRRRAICTACGLRALAKCGRPDPKHLPVGGGLGERPKIYLTGRAIF